MSLIEHAKIELEAAGFFDDELYEGMLAEALLELMEVFAKQGHSGMSASIVRSAFHKLANYEPLCPLTGEDDEWNEVDDDLWQNKRCSRVFKTSEGAYDTDGKVFREPNGVCYTSKDSRVPVTFPYTPTSEFVDVPATEVVK